MSADRFKQAAKANDSGSWNKYSYTRGDPGNRFDPHGMYDDLCSEDPESCEPPCEADPSQPECGGGGGPGPGYGINPDPDPTTGGGDSSLAALLQASKARVGVDLSNADCDKALGASSVAAAEDKFKSIDIGFKDLGTIKVDQEIDGSLYPVKGSAPIARYNPVVGFRNIRLNTEVNWANPDMTIVTNQIGKQIIDPLLSAEANYLGVSSLTAAQYMDIIILHELSHAFRGTPDKQSTEQNIFTQCVH